MTCRRYPTKALSTQRVYYISHYIFFLALVALRATFLFLPQRHKVHKGFICFVVLNFFLVVLVS